MNQGEMELKPQVLGGFGLEPARLWRFEHEFTF